MWKAKVDHLGASIDRCREHIDEMVYDENDQRSKKMSRLTEQYRKQVYNSGAGTTVEVSIKTKKPSLRSVDKKDITRLRMEKDGGKNWDTLLSQDDDQSDSFSPTIIKRAQSLPGKPKIKEAIVSKRTVPHKRTKTSRSLAQRNAKVPVELKQFAQKTKSSRSKEMERDENLPKFKDKHMSSKDNFFREGASVTNTGKELAKAENVGSALNSQKYLNENMRHEFPNRTLQIFLRELRSAVNSSAADITKSPNNIDLNKIIDDIEFVAANLNPFTPGVATFKGPNVIDQQTSNVPSITPDARTKTPSDTIVATQMLQQQIVRQLQFELEKVRS